MQKGLIKFIDATEEHIDIIFKWRNEPFIREVMYNSDLLQWENHMDWFNLLLNDNSRLLKILYYDNIPYGSANFRLIDKESKVGEWGFYIGEKNAPKGMGTILAYMMLTFLFEDMKVRKICAEVLDFNTISLRFHEKVGFQKDGVLREHIFKNDRYCDIHLYSIFIEDWKQSRLILERELFN